MAFDYPPTMGELRHAWKVAYGEEGVKKLENTLLANLEPGVAQEIFDHAVKVVVGKEQAAKSDVSGLY